MLTCTLAKLQFLRTRVTLLKLTFVFEALMLPMTVLRGVVTIAGVGVPEYPTTVKPRTPAETLQRPRHLATAGRSSSQRQTELRPHPRQETPTSASSQAGFSRVRGAYAEDQATKVMNDSIFDVLHHG